MVWGALGKASQPALGVLSALAKPLRPEPAPVTLPTGVEQQPATPLAELDAQLAALQSKKQAWANTPAAERARLLRRCLDLLYREAEGAAALLVAAKGSYGGGLGDERLGLAGILLSVREYAEVLEAGERAGPNRTYQRPSGQWVAEVLPQGMEGMFFGGFTGEVWLQPGQQPTRARLYRELAEGKQQAGAVALVLGAGNQASVAVLDILHMLISENCVVCCKLNPVLDFLRPFLERALAPLVQAGCLALACGGAQQGRHLCAHAAVDRIHLTGSAQTFDAIVWQGRPKEGSPPLAKPVTAELGCVTPCIVVPGRWSAAAIEYHADECVASLVNNAGHNCVSLELLVTCAAWPQRQQFVQAVRNKLAAAQKRVAWYPGSCERHAAFKRRFPDAESLGTDAPEAAGEKPPAYLPWLLKAGLSPAEADTQTENWCGVLQEVCLPTEADSASFLAAATEFANERCWGSLSCSVVSPPDADAAALDAAIERLRYGLVAVNAPTFVGYSFGKLSWGAFAGNTPQDVGSGIGCVHNALLLEGVQKSVLRAPWLHHPTHLWSPGARNLDATSRQLLRFAAFPGLLSLAATALAALRG